MFFVKAAFWIFLVFLLLPSNGREKFELFGVVERTVADIGGFCQRNPDVCEQVSNSAQGLVDKLHSTVRMIEQGLEDTGIGARRENMGEHPANSGQHGRLNSDPAMTASSSPSGDTLTSEDLRPAWQGPDGI